MSTTPFCGRGYRHDGSRPGLPGHAHRGRAARRRSHDPGSSPSRNVPWWAPRLPAATR